MPVVRSQIVHVGFGASHILDKHPVCSRRHGHYYTVAATFTGEVPAGNWGEVLLPEQFVQVVGVIRELSGSHINDMMPASYASPNGIAAYLLERLRMHGAAKVEVHESDTDTTGIAEQLSG
jgi:6-pyruvoyl-tetrahydropterin synthase